MQKLKRILSKATSHEFFKYWLIVIALLFTVHGFTWDDIYINRTKEHYTCVFADGSHTEYKETFQWLFYAELFPHAQTRRQGKTVQRYVNARGQKFDGIRDDNAYCTGVGKKDGRFISSNAFEDLSGTLIRMGDDIAPDALSWRSLPKEIGTSMDQNPQIREFTQKESLYAGARWRVWAMSSNEKHLLAEQPMTALNHPSIPFDTVLYVYQTESFDFGQTWSTPVITKQAKLFEIGVKQIEQSWAAKRNWKSGDKPSG